MDALLISLEAVAIDRASPISQKLPSNSAVAKVFGTTELLELILLEVDHPSTLPLSKHVRDNFCSTIQDTPEIILRRHRVRNGHRDALKDFPKTLLLSKRVSKAFRDTIEGSEKLRKVIYQSEIGFYDFFCSRSIIWFLTTSFARIRFFSCVDMRVELLGMRTRGVRSLRDSLRVREGSWRHFHLPQKGDDMLVYVISWDTGPEEYTARNIGLEGCDTVGELVDRLIMWCVEKWL